MSDALYPRFDAPDYPAFERQIRAFWEAHDIFTLSVSNRSDAQAFTFYEGPPSANGSPGIHHVMARTIKDLVCRYKTLAGYQVERKAGWDTHGLPVELQVEKALGITKKDIGDGPEHKISLADYNQKCREDVLKYKDEWDELTKLMGFWVNLDDPYITYERDYIESVWHLLKRLYDKDLLYKGYTIQPYSPAAGTGLSSHELNQPGCYRDVKDTSVTALFKAEDEDDLYFIAWTTTPWTLPSNAALGVGPKIAYAIIRTINPYTDRHIRVVVAKDRIPAYFAQPLAEPDEVKEKKRKSLEVDGKTYYFRKSDLNAKAPLLHLEQTLTGSELVGMRYEQLMPYVQPDGKAFEVIAGDFVTTEDGTGIVHLAPTFGADDKRVADDAGIVAITVPGEQDDEQLPLVDKQGKFVRQMSAPLLEDLKAVVGEGEESIRKLGEYLERDGGFFVKAEYADADDYPNMDIEIATLLKKTDRAFKVEKYEHNYPHCWRTDKPVLYYPLDSWFIKTTALKDRLVELNQEDITWEPAGTGTGRFGNWLENLTDWNLSRSRFWGTPLPIWVNAGRTEMTCIGSVEELRSAAREALAQKPELLQHYTARLNESYPALKAEIDDLSDGNAILDALLQDLHRPFVDEIVLLDSAGNDMRREPDLIDVWFDSGAMPYAQWHYPFENQDIFKRNFPADFIAEGVDQTRGWFFTLHAIATLLEDSVAYKNVIANGLVQDKDGRKMSKRLGNAVDPFETINTHGADATRWYMVANAPPWENLRFNIEHLEDTKRKFLGTLYYTYDFFALYANIDGFTYDARKSTPIADRTELDRWILSVANSTLKEARAAFDDYDP
ncbi:MAG: isoleucine--tRNA ligase, partial [Bacteroidota bacterium]